MFKTKIAFETKESADNFLRICEKLYPEITKLNIDNCILEIEGNFKQFPKDLIMQVRADFILECIFLADSKEQYETFFNSSNYQEAMQKIASEVDSYFEFIMQIERLLNFNVQEAKIFEIYIKYENIGELEYSWIRKYNIFQEEKIKVAQENLIIKSCEEKICNVFKKLVAWEDFIEEVRKYNYFEFNGMENRHIEENKSISRCIKRIECLPKMSKIDKNLQMLDKSLTIKERFQFVLGCLNLYDRYNEDLYKAMLAIIKFKRIEGGMISSKIIEEIIKLEIKDFNGKDAMKILNDFLYQINNLAKAESGLPVNKLHEISVIEFLSDLQEFLLTDEELQKLDAKPPISILNL